MRGSWLVIALFVTTSQAALADNTIQRSGPEIFKSRNEISPTLGWQLGFPGRFGNPWGLKVGAEYAYRFHPIAWFDLQLNQVFGTGPRDNGCTPPGGVCYKGGWETQIAAGVKLKLPLKTVPLVFEIPLLVGVNVMYNRDCGDSGAGITGKVGGGFKWFPKQNVGLGAATNFAFGPGIHGSSPCLGSYVDFYGAWDFLLGAEIIL